MAIGSTVYKVSLNIADLDRHYYAEHDLTIARHPSETDLRLMVRIAAFALNADEHLTFTKGLCVEEEPELWLKDYGGDIELWIELGQADEKRLRKACGRAERVVLYTYQEKSARDWWRANAKKLQRFKNLSVVFLEASDIANLAERSMQLQCNICDGELTLHDDRDRSVTVTQERWQ
jgi:uncharacterized protein YaeQ